MRAYSDRKQQGGKQTETHPVAQGQRSGAAASQFADRRPQAIVQRRHQELANDSPRTKRLVQLQAIAGGRGVVQCLSAEYYDRAELRYSSRAFAHMSQDELEQYLWDNKSQIVVGEDKVILIGGGLRTGYAVNGCIRYNCHYDENAGRHVIYVYHAHDHGRMG